MAEETPQLSDFDGHFEDPSEDPLFDLKKDDANRVDIFTRKDLLKDGPVQNTGIVLKSVLRDSRLADLS